MYDSKNLSINANDTAQTLADKLISFLPKVTACFLAVFLSFVQTGEAITTDQNYAKAKKFFQQKNWSKANNRLLAIKNQASGSIENKRVQFLRALIHTKQGKPEETIKLLEPLSIDYVEVEDYIRFHLIQAQAKVGNHIKAQENVYELFKRSPNSLLYARLQLVLAESQIKSGKKKEGIKTLKKTILSINKDNIHQKFREFLPNLIFKLAETQEQSGKQQDAYLNFRQLHIKHPNHSKTPKAEKALKRLSVLGTIKNIPLTLREHTERIKGLFKSVQYKEVIEEIQQLKKRTEPLPGRFYFFLAQAHKGLRDRKKANEVLLQFLKKYPHHAKTQTAKFDIGRNLWNLGKPMAGAKYFKEVTNNTSSSKLAVKAQFFLGKIYEESKNFPEALKNYTAALEKYPEEDYGQWAGWRLGWIHYLDGEFEQAFKKFQEVANRFPEKSFI
jgi:tetratricopeptide (TPR) repeat protein